jgi:thiol-disulfide isomerase/thioredoxin
MLDILIERGVVIAAEDGDKVRLAGDFNDEIERKYRKLGESGNLFADYTNEAAKSSISKQFSRVITKMEEAGDFNDVERMIAAEWLALKEINSSFSEKDAVNILIIIDLLRRGYPSVAGAPESFLPVRGDQLPFLLRVSHKSLVYVWRTDCKPCDEMRAILDEIFSTSRKEVGRYAIYGPDWKRRLKENYRVVGAPTTLFMVKDRVDARLQGAYHKSVVEKEIGELIEQ